MSGFEKTPVSYSREELKQIREMLANELSVRCPNCGAELQSGGVYDARDSQQDVWALVCDPCNRMAILRDVTE